MKRLFNIFFVAILLSACTADLEEQIVRTEGESGSAKILNSSTNSIGGSLLVRFDSAAESRLAECATRSGATRTGVSGVDAVLDDVKGYAVEPVFVITDKNREKVHAAGLHLWYELRFDEECDVEVVATRLADVAEVKRVEFVHRVHRIGNPKVVECGDISEMPVTRAKIPFNDVYSRYQWGLNNLGLMSEVKKISSINGLADVVAGADINVVPAWELCTGDPSIVVAIVDEGVMHSHEDLAANMWVNHAELNGKMGTDDDGNGYKDDIYGFNFSHMNGTITWNGKTDSGHGSHVAGIVSAVSGNGIGVCGIAGGSGNSDGARLMSVQIFSGDSGATTSQVSRAIQYAADNGAHILQCSWGYLSAEDTSADPWDRGPANDREYKYQLSTEAAAIDYFIANGGSADGPIDGGLVIFAAGNSGAVLPGYPAAYEPCVAVAAISPSLRPTYYTDHGPGTDICAPGGESTYKYGAIFSTVPKQFADSSTEYYGMMQGTSQACPHVSGVAALGLSYAKQLGKRYTAKEFRSMLLSATNDIEPYLTGEMSFRDIYGYSYYMNYSDFTGKLGAGYIDAYKLLLQVDGTPFKVVKVGQEIEVDLSLYFGEGLANAEFVRTEVSTNEMTDADVSVGEYSNGKISVTCSKRGVATISVTMLVGGGSIYDKTKPFPTEVTRKFVVIAKEHMAANGGWL